MYANLWIAVLGLVTCGCAPIGYYWQGVRGQAELLACARPVDELIATTDDAALRERLERARDIRSFAARELALPDNASYSTYADLGRPFVVWNVVASPEFSLQPVQSCFPVAGCVSYRGFFAESDARAEARRQAAAGNDVYVGGVPAYSTLGWLDDPLLSTFVHWREVEVARLLFHELAHQVVYVQDDTAFNESFATAVEEAGVERWLAARQGRADHALLVADATRMLELRREFRQLVGQTRARLEAIYGSGQDAATMRCEKAAAFARMRDDHDTLKRRWGGAPVFDRWFAGGTNNAGIAAASLYADRVPQFAAILRVERGDFARFHARVRELARLPRDARNAALDAMPPAAATPR